MGMARFGAALAACLLAVGPAAAAPVPGVTDTEITIGITGPLTGPAAAWGTIALASEAYGQWVNQQGGVHGRKLKFVIKDDGYNPGRAVANLNEMKDQVFAVIGTVGTAVLNASKDVVADAGLPLVYPLGNVQVFAKQPKEKVRTVFQNYPDYADEAEFLAPQAAKLAKAKKIALFGQNDDWGKEAAAGAKRGLAKVPGVGLAEVYYEVTDRELGTHALKLKDSGAEAVILACTVSHAAGIVKEMAKVGYRPQIFATFPLSDKDTLFRVAGDLWAGVHYDSFGAFRGEPAADKAIELVVKIDPKLKGREAFVLQGVADVRILVEGLKRAGKDLTREKFVKAMETIADYDAEGFYPKHSYGPGHHHGFNAVRLMKAGKSADEMPVQVAPWQFFQSHF